MHAIDALKDEFWVDREHERELARPAMVEFVMADDSLWGPDTVALKSEVQWDKARLDALSMFNAAVLRGAKIDITAIAVETAQHISDEQSPFYDNEGRITSPKYIIEDNACMLRDMMAEEIERSVRRESNMQRAIADELKQFQRVDLTIPTQRQVANRVRAKYGFPPLAELASDDDARMVDAQVPEMDREFYEADLDLDDPMSEVNARQNQVDAEGGLLPAQFTNRLGGEDQDFSLRSLGKIIIIE